MNSFKQYLIENTQPLSPKFKTWSEGLPLITLDRDGKTTIPKSGFIILSYHGTESDDFDVFDTKKAGYHYGEGSYFTPEQSRAKSYSKSAWASEYSQTSKLYTVYLKFSKPFITASDEGVMNLAHTEARKGTISNDWGGLGASQIGNSLLRKNKYDGVVKQWPSGEIVELVIFEPNQAYIIKKEPVKESISNLLESHLTVKTTVEPIATGATNENTILKKDGKEIGHIKISLYDDGKKWLSGIYIEPEFRREGYATKLVNEIIRRHGTPIYLRIFSYKDQPLNDDKLIAFYKKLGFKQIPNKNKYYMRYG